MQADQDQVAAHEAHKMFGTRSRLVGGLGSFKGSFKGSLWGFFQGAIGVPLRG